MKLKPKLAVFLFAMGIGGAAFAVPNWGCQYYCVQDYMDCIELGNDTAEQCEADNRDCVNACPELRGRYQF